MMGFSKLVLVASAIPLAASATRYVSVQQFKASDCTGNSFMVYSGVNSCVSLLDRSAMFSVTATGQISAVEYTTMDCTGTTVTWDASSGACTERGASGYKVMVHNADEWPDDRASTASFQTCDTTSCGNCDQTRLGITSDGKCVAINGESVRMTCASESKGLMMKFSDTTCGGSTSLNGAIVSTSEMNSCASVGGVHLKMKSCNVDPTVCRVKCNTDESSESCRFALSASSSDNRQVVASNYAIPADAILSCPDGSFPDEGVNATCATGSKTVELTCFKMSANLTDSVKRFKSEAGLINYAKGRFPFVDGAGVSVECTGESGPKMCPEDAVCSRCFGAVAANSSRRALRESKGRVIVICTGTSDDDMEDCFEDAACEGFIAEGSTCYNANGTAVDCPSCSSSSSSKGLLALLWLLCLIPVCIICAFVIFTIQRRRKRARAAGEVTAFDAAPCPDACPADASGDGYPNAYNETPGAPTY